MTVEHDAALLAATRWYGTHRAQHLARDCDQMVDRCATYLMERLPLARASAQQVAMQSLAELESGGLPGFIDIDRSSSRMVLLRNSATGTTHMLTLPELFWLVENRNRLQDADSAQAPG